MEQPSDIIEGERRWAAVLFADMAAVHLRVRGARCRARLPSRPQDHPACQREHREPRRTRAGVRRRQHPGDLRRPDRARECFAQSLRGRSGPAAGDWCRGELLYPRFPHCSEVSHRHQRRRSGLGAHGPAEEARPQGRRRTRQPGGAIAGARRRRRDLDQRQCVPAGRRLRRRHEPRQPAGQRTEPSPSTSTVSIARAGPRRNLPGSSGAERFGLSGAAWSWSDSRPPCAGAPRACRSSRSRARPASASRDLPTSCWPRTTFETVVRVVQCSPKSSGVALKPFIEVLRAAAAIGDDDAPAERRRKLADLLAHVGLGGEARHALLCDLMDQSAPAASSPRDDDYQRAADTRDLLCEIVAASCRRSPMVLLIEDAHWIDRVTDELIQATIAKYADARLALDRYASSQLCAGLASFAFRHVNRVAASVERRNRRHDRQLPRRRARAGRAHSTGRQPSRRQPVVRRGNAALSSGRRPYHVRRRRHPLLRAPANRIR